MDLNMQLEFGDTKRVKEVEKKMDAKNYQPSMKEVWFTGWTNHRGTVKKGIFQTKVTDADKPKLQAVYDAILQGELPVGVTDMQKFTKAHATRLYKVLQEQRKHETIKKLISEIPDNYLLINNVLAFEKLLKDLVVEDEYALDTETTGLQYIGTKEKEADKVVGISFTLPKADYHVYIPINHTEGKQLPADYVLKHLKPVLENPLQKKIFFNAKFDVHMFIRHGIYVANVYFDGFVAMKLLNESEESYALKNLATKYGKHFGFNDKSATYEELFGKGGFQDTPFETKDGGRGIGTYYACKDTHLTYKFYKDFIMVHLNRLPKLKKLYFEIERPITDISIEMEQNGFLIDMQFARDYANTLKEQIDVLEAKVKASLGDININSPAQLGEALYDKLKLPDISKKRSTDKKVLKKLAEKSEAVALLLEYRGLNKLYTTYIQPMPMLTDKFSRLHGQFKQVATETGRFSSSNPNLQNWGAEARQMVIPAKDMIIIGIDFSQIEPRVLAHFTGDESMIEAYVMKRDLYIEMAMKVFKLERKYCEDKAYEPNGKFQPRKAIKSVLLGIMYGMGYKSLAQNVGVSDEEAKQIIADFYEAFPKVKIWMDEQIKFAEENEYIETMFGRKRRFVGFKMIAKRYHELSKQIMDILGHIPDFIWDEEYYEALPYQLKRDFWDVSKVYGAVVRKVVNTVIQGSSADIMKLAMIQTALICRLKGYKMLATIHDEILFEVPINIKREEVEVLEQAMLNVVQLKTPMKCDTAFMYRWGKETGKEEWYAQAS